MRPRQQTARHRRPALINTPQRSEGAWESCLARNAACGRGRFLLNGVGATRQGPRCQVALGRGCNRWRGPSPPRRRWHLSVAITTGTCKTGTSPPCPWRLNIVRAGLRTQGPGWFRAGRPASEAVAHRNATPATWASTEKRASARPPKSCVEATGWGIVRSPQPPAPTQAGPLSDSTVPAGMTRDIAHHRGQA